MSIAMTKTIALVLVSLAMAGLSMPIRRDHPVWGDDRAITLAEAVSLGDSALWVDARKDSDYAFDHYPGAIHLNERAWDAGMERFLTAWTPGKTIVVYCDSGGCRSSQHVAYHLEKDLDAKSRVLVGGWGDILAYRGADSP